MSHQTQTVGAPEPAFRMARLSNIVPVLALVIFGTLFARHMTTPDMAEVWRCLGMFSLWQWAAAIVLTSLSFRAIGTYNVLVHKVLNTGQTATAARHAAIKAIALPETLGFGAVTSALVRWRCLPDVSALSVARLSAVVSLSFTVALAVVAAVVVPLSGMVPYTSAMIAVRGRGLDRLNRTGPAGAPLGLDTGPSSRPHIAGFVGRHRSGHSFCRSCVVGLLA